MREGNDVILADDDGRTFTIKVLASAAKKNKDVTSILRYQGIGIAKQGPDLERFAVRRAADKAWREEGRPVYWTCGCRTFEGPGNYPAPCRSHRRLIYGR